MRIYFYFYFYFYYKSDDLSPVFGVHEGSYIICTAKVSYINHRDLHREESFVSSLCDVLLLLTTSCVALPIDQAIDQGADRLELEGEQIRFHLYCLRSEGSGAVKTQGNGMSEHNKNISRVFGHVT